MQVQYDKYFDERGQITVFLSLLFLVLMMSFLFIVEGVISYSASSLGEDAVKGAGESIMANYDRELFKNYHLFFLDPRQKDYIVTDGKEFINQYFSGNSFFDIYCDSLEVTGEKTAVDEDGLYLKHEIREWMKYREEKEIAKVSRLYQLPIETLSSPYHLRVYRKRTDTEMVRSRYGGAMEIVWRCCGIDSFPKREVSVKYYLCHNKMWLFCHCDKLYF